MTLTKYTTLALGLGLLTACGGGGGGAATTPDGSSGPSAVTPVNDPTAPGSNNTYRGIDATSGTSTLGGAVLSAGSSVAGATGTITHSNGTFTGTGISGSQSLSDTSPFDLPDFDFATDVELSSGVVAIVGVATEVEDIRTSGTAAYTGQFSGQLVDASLGASADTLNWDADIQISFAGDGDVALTFEGGGSDLIDTIRITNARIDGNGFSGGTLRTSNNGVTNNVTGTDVDLDGAFFGYNGSLLLPGEVGGAMQSSDANTDISGVFLTRAEP